MGRNLFDEVSYDTLRKRRSIKWNHFGSDVLPLWIAEMDVPLAEPIAEVLTAAIQQGDTGYASPGRLREAFAGYAQRSFGWSPDPGRMLVVPDVVRGITEVIRAATEPGAGIVINPPVYPPFFSVIESTGRRIVTSPLLRAADGTYRLDLAALDRDFAGASAYLLCNPHNPTGIVLTADELATIAELADRHGVRLLVDEIHAPLVYSGHRHSPIATLPSAAIDRAIIFTSASKAWNLPGMKAALVIAAGDDAWRVVSAIPIEATFGTGLFGVLAGEVAFDHGDAWLARVMSGLQDNRDALAGLLTQFLPGVGYVPPQSTYLAWLDFRSLNLGDDPAATLLERAKVALSNGPGFGLPGRGYARLNFATAPAILEEAIRRICAAV